MIIWALWSKWYDYIGDPTLADAIMARLAANASKIELKSDSMRQKKKKSIIFARRQNWNFGTVCSDTNGTDCSDSMVPIQRYRHIKNLIRIDSLLRALVKEVTLDFSESMHSIVEACFPNAMITLDRFHHQQFCLKAVQEVRIALRREEMTHVANEREEFRLMLKAFAEKGETS